MKNIKKFQILRGISLIFLIFLISGCGKGFFKKVDARKIPGNVNERAQKNIQEGRGFRLSQMGNQGGSGRFEFATSNEMWRASIELLEFTPLSNVDYSGGIIITDWFKGDDNKKNESIKITVRFLSNEIRADGINVIIHKKNCISPDNCNISQIKTTLSQEIKLAILKKAAQIKENEINKDPDYKDPRVDQ